MDNTTLTPEKALRIYTDSLIANRPIQLLSFREKMSLSDFEVFKEEAKMLDLLHDYGCAGDCIDLTSHDKNKVLSFFKEARKRDEQEDGNG